MPTNGWMHADRADVRIRREKLSGVRWEQASSVSDGRQQQEEKKQSLIYQQGSP